MKRHGRLETVRNNDGTFHLRLVAANGRCLMHSEQLTGRQVERAKDAFVDAAYQAINAFESFCRCPACEREAKR